MKYLFTLCLLLVIVTATAQNLTFKELTSLVRKDEEQINNYLINKNWKFYKDTDTDSTGYSFTSWGYFSKWAAPEDTEAIAWFELAIRDNTIVGENYQFSDKSLYTAFLNAIKSMGLKKTATVFVDNGIKTTYLGKSFSYVLVVHSHISKGSQFSISISFQDVISPADVK